MAAPSRKKGRKTKKKQIGTRKKTSVPRKECPRNQPRCAAFLVLKRLEEEGRPLDAILESFLDAAPPYDRRDVNLIHALVFGVQRWRGTLDHVIGHLSNTPLAKLDPDVRHVLRMALFQILFMDRIPPSAAVNTAVDIIKTCAPRHVAGFVNGLLRSAVRDRGNVPFPAIEDDPVSALAASKSFPKWIVRRWLDRWGLEETAKLCDAVNRIPPLTLRANTLRTDREELVTALEGDVDSAAPTPFSPDGISISGLKAPLQDLAAFRTGLFQVQDEAAQLVSRFLGPAPGETVMDACAGLGGKTAHLAALMNNQGRIAALELHSHKLDSLALEALRLGISMIAPACCDLDAGPPASPFGLFDRVLLDAPCSGLGVMNRNPDAKWAAGKKDLGRYQRRQLRFLTHLAPLLRPGGTMGYAVCSMEKEETDDVVAAFLGRHPDFAVKLDISHLPADARSLVTADGCLRTFPHRDGMDGFFSVCFVRKL